VIFPKLFREELLGLMTQTALSVQCVLVIISSHFHQQVHCFSYTVAKILSLK